MYFVPRQCVASKKLKHKSKIQTIHQHTCIVAPCTNSKGYIIFNFLVHCLWYLVSCTLFTKGLN